MKKLPISNELKQVLLQWDDTNDETCEASKSRLDALGPNVITELTVLTYFLERRYWLGVRISTAGFVSGMLGALLTSFFLPDGHAPLPFWAGCSLGFSALLLFGGFVAGGLLTSAKIAISLLHALAILPPSQSLALLTHLRYDSAFNNANHKHRMTTIRTQSLITVLNQVTEAEAIVLTPGEMRQLCALVTRGYADLSVAGLRALAIMNDASLVPVMRKWIQRTRNWEVQEAANDYLRRFAPEDVAIRSPLRADVSQNTAELPANVAPILACVMRLGSRNPAERQTAENMLRAMQPEELTQVLQLLNQEPPAERRISHAILAASFVIGALLGSLIYFWALRWPYFDAHMAMEIAVGCAFGCGAFGCLKGSNINYGRRNRRRAQLLGSKGGIFPEKRLLDVLGALENVALIGAILDHIPAAVTLTGETLRQTLRQSLQNLLTHLRASDANLLTEQHRNWLNHELQRSAFKLSDSWAGKQSAERQADFDIAILKAWEQVGDERALTLVQQLAAMTAKSPAKKRVREAAEQCLPYLEARVGEQRQTQTLLRAAEMPTVSGDILLRAATPTAAPVEAEQLLRAGIRNSNEDQSE